VQEGDAVILPGLEVILHHGLAVFPCRERTLDEKRKAKSPLVENGLYAASTDRKRIAEWQRQHPGCAWGAAMTETVVAVDIDVKHDHDGFLSLKRLIEGHDQLPDTLTNTTPTGGEHRLFRVDRAFKNKAAVMDGIDIRSKGGYICVPPSVIETGPYEWRDPQLDIAPAPAWFIEDLARLTQEKVGSAAESGGSIPEGRRNDALYRYTCLLRARNLPDETAWDALQARNRDCSPPLDDGELKKIFANAWKYPPGFALTDLGNCDRLIAAHGDDLRFLVGAGWHNWERHRFVPDRIRRVIVLMGTTARNIYAEAAESNDPDRRKALGLWAKTSESRGRIENALALAEAQPGVADLVEHYDTDPLLIGMPNGVYDLRHDEFRDGRRADRITLSSGVEYDPTATCPRWECFQSEIHEHDADMVAFKQRAWGYTLSGDTSEQKLFIGYGDGANGKTTEQNIAFDVLGDYARKIEPETLLSKDRQGINNDIARLRGARYIGTEETGDGKALAENLVKQLTGRNRLAARFLYREHFEFTLTGKIWIATNHRPEIAGTDFAIWRRILLLPYPVQFDSKNRDPNLEAKLLGERAGILNWMIEGFRQWQRLGLAAPQKVVAATDQYRADMDRVGAFLRDCCQLNVKGSTKAADVYKRYKSWTQENGGRPTSARKFHERLERDHKQYRVKRTVEEYVGLLLTAWTYGDATDL
jgi:putative DNA primase/helicase